MPISNALCTNAKCRVFLLNYATDLSLDEPAPAFCPECGYGVIDTCPHCNAKTLESWPSQNSCHKCGERLRLDPDPTTVKATITLDE